MKPDNRLKLFVMGGVSFTQNKAKAKRGIKVKVFIRPLTLLYLFFLVGLSIFISQKKVKNLDQQNFSQFFVITLTRPNIIGKKKSESMSK